MTGVCLLPVPGALGGGPADPVDLERLRSAAKGDFSSGVLDAFSSEIEGHLGFRMGPVYCFGDLLGLTFSSGGL